MTDHVGKILQIEGLRTSIKSFIGLKQFPTYCKSDAEYMAYLIKRLLVLKFEQAKITLSSIPPPPDYYPLLKSLGYNHLINTTDIDTERKRRQQYFDDDDTIRMDLLDERVDRIKTRSILDLPLTDIYLGIDDDQSEVFNVRFGPRQQMIEKIPWDIMLRETQILRHLINLWTSRITQYKFIREIAGREPAFAVAEAERLQLTLNDLVTGPYPDSPLIYPNSWGTPENFEKGLKQLENEKEILVTRRNNLLILLYAIGYQPHFGAEIQEMINLTRNKDHIMSVGEFIDKITRVYHSYIINRQIFKKILFSMISPVTPTKFPERNINWEIFSQSSPPMPGMPGIVPIRRGEPGGPLIPAPVVGELEYYEELRRTGRIDRSPVPLPEAWRRAAESSLIYRIIENDPLITRPHTPTYSIRVLGAFGAPAHLRPREAPLEPFNPFREDNYIMPRVGTPLEEAVGAARQYEFPVERIFNTRPNPETDPEPIPPHPGPPPPPIANPNPSPLDFGGGYTLPPWYSEQLRAYEDAVDRAEQLAVASRVYHPTRVQYSEDEPVTLDRIWAILNEIDASFNGTHFLLGLQGMPTNSFPTRFRLTRYKEILSLIEKFGRLKNIGSTSFANYHLEQKSSDFTSTRRRRSKRQSPRRRSPRRRSPRRKRQSPRRRSPRRRSPRKQSPRRSKH